MLPLPTFIEDKPDRKSHPQNRKRKNRSFLPLSNHHFISTTITAINKHHWSHTSPVTTNLTIPSTHIQHSWFYTFFKVLTVLDSFIIIIFLSSPFQRLIPLTAVLHSIIVAHSCSIIQCLTAKQSRSSITPARGQRAEGMLAGLAFFGSCLLYMSSSWNWILPKILLTTLTQTVSLSQEEATKLGSNTERFNKKKSCATVVSFA